MKIVSNINKAHLELFIYTSGYVRTIGAHLKLARPQITSVSNEMYATIGQQVTLRLSFIGTPQPTVAWTFKGSPIGEDPSVELSADGSLVIVCVEQRHAGRYIHYINHAVYCML